MWRVRLVGNTQYLSFPGAQGWLALGTVEVLWDGLGSCAGTDSSWRHIPKAVGNTLLALW